MTTTAADSVATAIPGLNEFALSDAFAFTKELPSECIDCTVTSPPYYKQRSYLRDSHPLKRFEMGQERSADQYVSDFADLFGEVFRVTKPGGSLWVNVADKVLTGDLQISEPDRIEGEVLGIPWRLAEAIRKKGWMLLPEVIWSKPNPMAGRRRDVVVSHEYLFHFAKGSGSYFDRVAISDSKVVIRKTAAGKEPFDQTVAPRSVWTIPVANFNGRKLIADIKENGEYLTIDPGCPVHGDDPTVSAGPLFGAIDPDLMCTCTRVVDDHFAVMPLAMAERCILATTSEVGNCPSCGKPWSRLVDADRVPTRPGTGASHDPAGLANRDPLRHISAKRTIGWSRPCKCPIRRPVRPVVFDPFSGGATTAVVAQATERDWIACDLNPVNIRKFGPARLSEGYTRTFAP